jgi:hypothetical protein
MRVGDAVRYSGLSRAELYVLLASGEIRSSLICNRGRVRAPMGQNALLKQEHVTLLAARTSSRRRCRSWHLG